MRPTDPSSSPPPGGLSPARRVARLLLAPVERFLAVEASSGIVLLAAAAIALVWANSPLLSLYEALWASPIPLDLGVFAFARDLRWWVNDGLMTIFFFVVGLEIRREMHAGELSQLRRAALPLAAALGGMVAPALLYTALNAGHPSSVGWGVAMATDIAFAVGVLALLGDRVAPALRILLLSLAVIDDLGAILVIAFFYSDGVALGPLAASALALAGVPLLQRLGVRSLIAYLPLAFVAWAGAYASGIHPTIAGVLLGLLTPVVATGAAESANLRLQHALHGWVAYGVMPVFALANAGVALGAADLGGDGWRVFAGVFFGLLLGKPIGVLALSRLSVAGGVAQAPRGVGWTEVSVVGVVAGIGFTMALFVAQLAFPAGPMLETAKLGILAASVCAGTLAYGLGRLVLRRPVEGAKTEAEAEGSTEV